MKKFFSLLLLTIALGGFAIGCSSPPPSPAPESSEHEAEAEHESADEHAS